MYLAQNLKYLRESNGEQQKALAQLLDVSEATMSKYENGFVEPDLKKIITVSEHYGVTLDNLVLKDLKPPLPVYADNILFLRKKHDCSQGDLADLLKVKQSTISLYETGKRKMSVDDLLIVSDFFGVTLDQLVKHDLSKEG